MLFKSCDWFPWREFTVCMTVTAEDEFVTCVNHSDVSKWSGPETRNHGLCVEVLWVPESCSLDSASTDAGSGDELEGGPDSRCESCYWDL